MGTRADIRTAVKDRTGKKDTQFEGVINRSINWAIKHICKTPFKFLVNTGRIYLSKNVTQYSLASDFSMFEWDKKGDSQVYVFGNPVRMGAVTAWILDNSTTKAGHFDAALDASIVAGSLVKINVNEYQIVSITGNGTAVNSVVLDYVAASCPVYYLAPASVQTVNTGTPIAIVNGTPIYATPGTTLATSGTMRRHQLYEMADPVDIAAYPDMYSKNCPKYFSNINATAAGIKQVAVGYPTADDSYYVEYRYFSKGVELVNDTDESIISKVYQDDPIIILACYKAKKDFWMDDFQGEYQEWILEKHAMKSVLPVREKPDFSVAKWERSSQGY